jgi:hypothetical protein
MSNEQKAQVAEAFTDFANDRDKYIVKKRLV